jgi:hypothetical protein
MNVFLPVIMNFMNHLLYLSVCLVHLLVKFVQDPLLNNASPVILPFIFNQTKKAVLKPVLMDI